MPQWGFYLFKVSWGATGGLCTEQRANGASIFKDSMAAVLRTG